MRSVHRTLILSVTLIIAGAKLAPAQSSSPDATGESTWKPARWTGIVGVHIGTPDRFSTVLGVGRVMTSRFISQGSRTGKVSHSDRDIFAAIEPGSRGARLSIGVGGMKDMQSRGATFLNARMSAYRHWSGDSSRVYIGPEISASGAADVALGLRTGLLVFARGPAGGRRYLVPVDFAIGW